MTYAPPKIELFTGKLLVGKSIRTSLVADRTAELWRSFMPLRSQIANATGTDLYSVQTFPAGYFTPFSPQKEFTKWAAIAVPDFSAVPENLETMTLPQGLYAVFLHKGAQLTVQKMVQHIFHEWLPASDYRLDNRPHFDVLGKNYRNNDMTSEEDIWIPIALKP